MQINSVQNKTFGQVYVSPAMKEKIKHRLNSAPADSYPTKATFIRNWNNCLNTTQFDILIENSGKVFILDKNGQRVMEEKLLSNTILNIDTALKRILLFEDADTFSNRKISKYS